MMNTKNRLSLALLVGSVLLAPGCTFRRKSSPKAKDKIVLHQGDAASANPDLAINSERLDFKLEPLEKITIQEDENVFAKAGEGKGATPTRVPQTKESWDQLKAEQKKLGFKTILFDFDKSDVREDQKEALDQDLAIIHKAVKKGNTVVVEGHACRSAGSAVYNMMLSEKRAEKVASYLVSKDIPSNKLHIVGRGYEMPVVKVGNREEQAPNRRVEFYVIKK